MSEEGISIRNLRDILEGVAPFAAQEKDPVVLADLARQALKRHISYELAPRGRLLAWFLSPDVSEAIRESIVRTPSGNFLRLDPRLGEEIRELAANRIGSQGGIVVCDPDIRRYVWILLEPRVPRLRVISHAELNPGTVLEPLGTLGP
jgi:type III secretory pathway component EscV